MGVRQPCALGVPPLILRGATSGRTASSTWLYRSDMGSLPLESFALPIAYT